MVRRVAVVALEAAHGAIVFGRGLPVAIEAGQGLVEFSGLGRHCEDRTTALSLELKATRAEGWVGGWSDPRDCFVFSSLCWRGEIRGCNEEWATRSRLHQGAQNFGCTMRSAQAVVSHAPLARLAQATTTCGATFRPALWAPGPPNTAVVNSVHGICHQGQSHQPLRHQSECLAFIIALIIRGIKELRKNLGLYNSHEDTPLGSWLTSQQAVDSSA